MPVNLRLVMATNTTYNNAVTTALIYAFFEKNDNINVSNEDSNAYPIANPTAHRA